MNSWLTQTIEFLPEGPVYLALIALVAFLEALPLVGLAMPGSTLIVLAGFLSAHGKGEPFGIALSCIGGAFVGDVLSYWLGGRLGNRLLKTAWLQKRQSTFRDAELFFREHGGKSLFYARFLGPIRGTIPFLAGISRMNPRYFGFSTLISSILWGIAYPGSGYLGGESWQKATDWSTRLGLLVLLALCVTLFHLWLRHKAGQKK